MHRSPARQTFALAIVLALSEGCSSSATVGTVIDPPEPEGEAPLPLVPTSVDLLVMVDNSRSMADKQALLAQAVPGLVQRLVSPLCLSEGSGLPIPAGSQPDQGAPCPAGSRREFPPVADIHMAVISSSLGGHGSDACRDEVSCDGTGSNPSGNDRGHLLSRRDPCAPEEVPTYADKGFLSWDPWATGQPPGENDAAALSRAMTDLVLGAGQAGCGFEAQLESWFRFLADPAPYESIAVEDGAAKKTGVDQVLLQQRADFLRPDSLLAIVMLTDENDCSVIDGGQYFYALQQKQSNGKAYHLPQASAACAANPEDPCCYSCSEPVPDGCAPEPTCEALDDLEDNINLRCFEQKRRFGIDFLYPVQRYVNALTKKTFDPSDVALEGEGVVSNPIFSDLVPGDEHTQIRDPGLVVLTGIVGVPWHHVVRDPANPASGPKSAAELSEVGADGLTTWDRILGDPTTGIAPADPHMWESVEPRADLPLDGDDGIHGHEYTIAERNDLQYACTMPIPEARDCTDHEEASKNCDCMEPSNDNPLCETNPQDPGNGRTRQTRAKAYPGLRELAVLKGLGSQAVVASICSPTVNPADPTSGYVPTMTRLVDTMRVRLAP